MPESCSLFSNLSRNFSSKYVSSPFSSMLLKLLLLNYHCARVSPYTYVYIQRQIIFLLV